MITLKTEKEIALMRHAGHVLDLWFQQIQYKGLRDLSPVGVEADFQEYLRQLGDGWEAPFIGIGGYKYGTCVSVNDQVVHTAPISDRKFQELDVIKVDAGLKFSGYCADKTAVYTICSKDVNVPIKNLELIGGIEEALDEAMAVCKPGNMISEISKAIYKTLTDVELSVISDFGGHGIGANLHEPPYIQNDPARIKEDTMLRAGMVICIEPLACLGSGKVVLAADKMGVLTADGSLAAHVEETVLITKDGYEILTRV